MAATSSIEADENAYFRCFPKAESGRSNMARNHVIKHPQRQAEPTTAPASEKSPWGFLEAVRL